MLLHVHVEHADVLAAGMTVAAGKRDVLAEVAAEVDDTHEGKTRRQLRQCFCRVVTAAIVDKDQLRLDGDTRGAKVLLENFQVLLAEFLGQVGIVVNGNDKGVFDHGSNGPGAFSTRKSMEATIPSSPHMSKPFAGQRRTRWSRFLKG